MSQTTFLFKLTAEIMKQGYDLETAGRYAALIGDTPVFDNEGNILVQEGGQVVARLKPLKFFRNV